MVRLNRLEMINEMVVIVLPIETEEDVIPGGMADNANHLQFNPIQLRKGIKVEMEHTSDPDIAMEIAMDHLMEDPEYYNKLEEIHESIKKRGSKWVVLSKKGKVLGTHDTKKEATKQLQAIEISKHR